MTEIYFQERDEYCVYCFATPLAGGAWEASVTFELTSDFKSEKAHHPVVRHKDNALYRSRDEAMKAASRLVNTVLDSGRVGLLAESGSTSPPT